MFSREEAKEVRQQFWIFFGKRYPRKWLLYHTGIKDVALKFDFDNKLASVAIECTATDEIDRGYYYEKITSLKKLLLEEISPALIFEENYTLESGKEISRICLEKQDVNIHRKTDWPIVFDFFNTYMDKMEVFFLEYKEFIES
jgi:hypothetical protein